MKHYKLCACVLRNKSTRIVVVEKLNDDFKGSVNVTQDVIQ